MALPWFGLYLPQIRMSFDRILERTLAAEAAGFDSVWLMDHFAAPMAPDVDTFEGWTVATALAARTSTIRIGHLVLCDPFRHPVLLAKTAASFDVISNGRLGARHRLGIGTRRVAHVRVRTRTGRDARVETARDARDRRADVLGRAVRLRGRALHVARRDRAWRDPRFKLFNELPEDRFESFLSVPIVTRGHVVGVINLQNQEPHQYTTREITLVSTIGAFVGAEIEMARLEVESAQDVIERKKAEDRFYKAFTANPEPITIATISEERYIDVNESFLRVTGFRRDEVIGRTSLELKFLGSTRRSHQAHRGARAPGPRSRPRNHFSY